jgi:hypothetical protein
MILQAKKTNSEPTKEEYDSLILKLATLEAGLGQAREFMGPRARGPAGGRLGHGGLRRLRWPW